MENNVLVTIGAFNYNNAQYVIETLESIRQQTYENIEFFIIDDCSTDDSVVIISEWLKLCNRPYIFLNHNENKGFAFRLNEVIEQAKGKYFSLIATDDIMLNNKIQEQVALMESMSDKDIGMVYGDCMMIDENGEVINPSMFEKFFGKNFFPPSGNIFEVIVNNFYFYTQASLINIDLLKKINFKFDKNLLSEDWDLELAVSRSYEVYGVNKVYTKYRRLSTSLTSINWTNEKKHLVQESHFKMFYKYLSHPLNNANDRALLLGRIRTMYWLYFECKNSIYTNKISLFYKVFRASKNVKDFLILLKLALITKQ